jgi:hypothetical protein
MAEALRRVSFAFKPSAPILAVGRNVDKMLFVESIGIESNGGFVFRKTDTQLSI